MSKLLNELYTSRWYLTKQIEEMEKGSQFDTKGSFAAELKDNLEKLTKSISSYTTVKDTKEVNLWYPYAIIPNFKQNTKGKYAKKYPKGLVIHWIWAPQVGGKENAEYWARWGKDQGYTFFTLGNDGSVIQSFPLDEWGNHAGDANWTGLGKKISEQMVGIEILCEGKVQKFKDGRFGNETKEKRPDGSIKINRRYVNEADVRFISSNKENICRGYYQKFTEKQEESLIKLILWLKQNNPGVFDLNLVLGHDEVAGPTGLGLVNANYADKWRKTDPGGSLSVSMPAFRRLLIDRFDRT